MKTRASGIVSIAGQPAPDFTVTSEEGQNKLLVEVKTRAPYSDHTEAVWPVELRQEFGQFDCFFLLVTAERMMLFLPGSLESGGIIAGKDSNEVLASYLNLARFPLTQLGEQELYSVVRSWLGSIMFKSAETLLADDAQAWLVTSGLHAQIYRGYINREQAVA